MATQSIDNILGKRYEMITDRAPSDGRPGFRVKVVLDFTVVAYNPGIRQLRVHVNDAVKSRQWISWDAFWQGVNAGIVLESDKPALVHARQPSQMRIVR